MTTTVYFELDDPGRGKLRQSLALLRWRGLCVHALEAAQPPKRGRVRLGVEGLGAGFGVDDAHQQIARLFAPASVQVAEEAR